MEVINFITNNWQSILAALNALLAAIIAICVLIPGPEPEATLQKIVDFITKISRKPE